ncbi:MAG: FkbM family methyltransferase [Anaerolineae bacterium]|nr:FkbM family methyltransferase [Anaerolineae bacterium]
MILTGAGRGLRFNPAAANPGYALGTNEKPVQKAIAHYLRPGQVFYDIGANVGFFTAIAAKRVGPTGFVYAFEPVPENAQSIRHNINLNGFSQVTVFEQAVSDKSGVGALFVTHYAGGSTLSTVGKPSDTREVINVSLISIDDLVTRRTLLPPSLVKIDVEGAELDVLKGMRHTLKKHRPLLIYEIDDGNNERFRQKQNSCEAFLKNLDYTIIALEDSYQDNLWFVANFLARPQ